MKVNAIYGMMQAAAAGIGIAMLPDYVTEGQDKLHRVRPASNSRLRGLFRLSPALKNSKRVGVFRDFIVGKARSELLASSSATPQCREHPLDPAPGTAPIRTAVSQQRGDCERFRPGLEPCRSRQTARRLLLRRCGS
jgi:hypothetical protein